MTAPTLRQLLADVLDPVHKGEYNWEIRSPLELADALLASPLADIIDLAASHWFAAPSIDAEERVKALLADWRANRAEQKPTP